MALLELVERLRTDFEIDLAVGQAENPAFDLLKDAQLSASIGLLHVPTLRRSVHPWRDLKAGIRLYRLIKAGRYRLVHTHTSKAGILGRFAAAAAGVRVIIHSPHGTILEGYFSPSVTRCYAALERLAALVSSRIVCLTQLEISQFLRARIGRKNQYTYIYNGIDLDRFKPHSERREAQRRSLKLLKHDVVCATVGRLVPVKGQADLLKAFAQASQQEPDLRLLMIGDGELRSELEAFARDAGVAHRVHFLGWREDVADLLDAADVFVLSSLNEGLGLVLLEAMAKGLPIIATSVGGVPEVIGDDETGVLVPPSDPNALADAMTKLVRNEDLRDQLREAGLRRVRSTFSVDAAFVKTASLYRDLLKIRYRD